MCYGLFSANISHLRLYFYYILILEDQNERFNSVHVEYLNALCNQAHVCDVYNALYKYKKYIREYAVRPNTVLVAPPVPVI